MTYETLDPVIGAWAKQHGLIISTEFGGHPRRFCYVSAGEHECFQVSIEPPEDGVININVWDVEAEDHAELHRSWTVPSSELRVTLEAALAQITEWASRPLTRKWGGRP